MKKNNHIHFIFIVLFGLSIHAQSKKWTLKESVRYAIDNNITIKQSELDTKIATIDKKEALGNFIPSFNTNASHSWNIGLNQDITTGVLRNQTTQFTSLGASIGVDIYKGLQNQNTLRRANLSIVVAKYQLQKMQEDVALNVANAFLQVLFDKENLKVQQEQLEINKKQLARLQELVAAGSVPKGDLLDVKAAVALCNQKVITAENTLLISKLSIAQLLQLKDFENFEVTDENLLKDENTIFSKPVAQIYDQTKETNTALKIAKTNLEIAEKNLTIAKGAFQPTLSGSYNFNSRVSYANLPLYSTSGQLIGVQSPPSFYDQFNNNKGQYYALQLSIPIFNGFSVRNSVARFKVNLDKSKITLEQQNLDLKRKIYTAFADTKGALNVYESSLVSLQARQEAYNYAKEKFAVGIINSYDFNQAQTLLSNAQSEVLRTKYDYIFKIKILEFYFGIPIY